MNEPITETPDLLGLLEQALPYIEEAGTISGYGFYRPQNPHDFSPDPESTSEAELAAHKAACDAWDRGEYKRDPNQESGWVGNMHILKAPWGIGSYSEVTPKAQELMDTINAMLKARTT
jgi:hypothetical protein